MHTQIFVKTEFSILHAEGLFQKCWHIHSQKKSSVMWHVWPITRNLCIFNFKYSD